MVGTIAARNAGEILGLSGEETGDFEAVYRQHGPRLYGTALRMLRSPAEAEDVVQDAFLAYHQSATELERELSGVWLHRVVVNRCLDRLRRSTRWKMTEVTEETAVGASRSAGLGLDLEAAVARLPEKARTVFLLHDVEGLKHRELGKLLGLAEGTTKSQLFRARQMLREFMQRG